MVLYVRQRVVLMSCRISEAFETTQKDVTATLSRTLAGTTFIFARGRQ